VPLESLPECQATCGGHRVGLARLLEVGELLRGFVSGLGELMTRSLAEQKRAHFDREERRNADDRGRDRKHSLHGNCPALRQA